MVILQLFKTMEECLDMKKILVSFLVVLVGLSLTACGSNNKQAKENSSLKAQNSSLKAKEQQRENIVFLICIAERRKGRLTWT